MSRSIQKAISMYKWLISAKSGEVGVICYPGKTIKITVEVIEVEGLRGNDASLVIVDENVTIGE